ncbi:hypothetical protein C2E23DRAFT_880420 [Lenzites betulinus]|nr:hypothetical protein C2E23DRAFT_880420 [Lenzites betulinus]
MPVSTSLSFLELESLLREECRISEPREFRVQHGLGRIHGKEIFLVAPPSLGKTIVIVVPMLATQELEEQANALVIVPSKILTKQQARVFIAYDLTSLAINEDTLRQALYDRRDVMNEISNIYMLPPLF